MAEEEKGKALQVRISPEIDAMLQLVADYYGMKQGDAVRYLVCKRADEIKQERKEERERAEKD